jgi:hypothetical protein
VLVFLPPQTKNLIHLSATPAALLKKYLCVPCDKKGIRWRVQEAKVEARSKLLYPVILANSWLTVVQLFQFNVACSNEFDFVGQPIIRVEF